jgi:putative oxidoreductase
MRPRRRQAGIEMDQDLLLLVVRVCLSAVFFYSALDKLICWRNGLKFVNGLRLPQPRLVLAGTIVVQLAGGLAVLSGVRAREGALLLAVFTLVATLIAHNPLGLRGEEFRRQCMLSLEHLAIVGGLLLLAALGPGKFALM